MEDRKVKVGGSMTLLGGGSSGSSNASAKDLESRGAGMVKIVLEDPVIRAAFQQFLTDAYAEDVLRFWKDLDDLKQHGSSSSSSSAGGEENKTNAAARNDDAAALAEQIVRDYFGNGTLCEQLGVDHAAQAHALELCKLKRGKVTCRDPHVLRNAFNPLWRKVYGQLRIEYVPRFLVSGYFKDIKRQFEERWSQGASIDPVNECIRAMEEMDIEYIMRQPLALDCFESFLRRTHHTHGGKGKAAAEADRARTLVLLVQEIQSFRSSKDPGATAKRARKIHLRYGSGATLDLGDEKAQQVLQTDPTAAVGGAAAKGNDIAVGEEEEQEQEQEDDQAAGDALLLPRDLYDVVLQRSMAILNETHMRAFCESEEYRKCVSETTESHEVSLRLDYADSDDMRRDLAPSAAALFAPVRSSSARSTIGSTTTTTSTSASRRSVAGKTRIRRNTSSASGERLTVNMASLVEIASDKAYCSEFIAYLRSPVASYFKKFAIANFQAESIGFWIEADEFRRGLYTQTSMGSFIAGISSLDPVGARLARAKRICAKYLQRDANLEVNIEARKREAVVAAVEEAQASGGSSLAMSKDGKYCVVFDDVQNEIAKLMKDNLWDRFKESTSSGGG